MSQALQRAWVRRGPLAVLLLPVSWLFGAIAAVRRIGYRQGWLAKSSVRVPVVVVGNVVAGGSGKTPVVIALIEHLAERGIKTGVVSRGYGREGEDCREVTATGQARLSGDEPLLIAQRTGVPVFVAPRRAQAAQALLAAYPQTQLIICDDGLQHYALARDIEICVFDQRGIGNGWLLPAGPLREPWPRPVDLVLKTRAAVGMDGGDIIERALASDARDRSGKLLALSKLSTHQVIALAGIAQPEAFFDMLRSRGVTLAKTIALPDHAAIDASLLAKLPAEATIVCTEKDAVKLWPLLPRAFAVPLDTKIADSFWLAFDRLVDAKLSSAHGSETA